jgi:hypothetical protein
MALVCNATTPQEFRVEIVSLIRHRAAQERAVIGITSKAKRDAAAHEQAARQLDKLAAEIERMEIVNAWPSGLTEHTDSERYAEQAAHDRHHD